MEKKIEELQQLVMAHDHALEYDYVQDGHGFDKYQGYSPEDLIGKMKRIIKDFDKTKI